MLIRLVQTQVNKLSSLVRLPTSSQQQHPEFARRALNLRTTSGSQSQTVIFSGISHGNRSNTCHLHLGSENVVLSDKTFTLELKLSTTDLLQWTRKVNGTTGKHNVY